MPHTWRVPRDLKGTFTIEPAVKNDAFEITCQTSEMVLD